MAVLAVTARIRLYVGAGSAAASQLAFVPMLGLVPLGLVPLMTLVALILATIPDVLARREHPERLLTAAGDAGYAFAPAVVLSVTGADFLGGDWAMLIAAFAAQCALDLVLSSGREWIGRGIRPALQLRVMGTVYGVDALLMPMGVAVALEAAAGPAAVLAILPFAMLLAALARDRNRRLDEALNRVADVEHEAERVTVAMGRTARSLGYSLDRRTTLEVALGTAVDAVAAAAGRTRLAGTQEALSFDAVPYQPGAADADALLAAERSALAGARTGPIDVDGWCAIASPLPRREAGALPIGSLAVCRREAPFSPGERQLLAYLARQAAMSLEAIELHERLERQVSTDELTGLANHRRFQEILRASVASASLAGHALSLLLIDLDNFRAVNAVHGYQGGDRILRAVADVVRRHSRGRGEAARYGGQVLALILAGADQLEAWAVADELRTAVGATVIPLGDPPARVTVSIGVAALSARVASVEALIYGAETALDEAKLAGRDRAIGFRGPYTRA